jgi:radical SAM superfamily enzyme YgiQ (UPF0313 family)
VSAEIVLTASQPEYSDFGLNPYFAFTGGFPYFVPKWILRRYWYPPNRGFAPYGLRKVESLLLAEFEESQVEVVHPLDLHLGDDTKVIGISSMDPFGLAYVSKTYTGLLGGRRSIDEVEFRALLGSRPIRRAKERGAKIIVGGAGSWQIDEDTAGELGIDCVVIGEGENVVIDLFKRAVDGEVLPKRVQTSGSDRTSPIKKPSLFGVVEITRGCGKGCKFCSVTLRKRRSIPLETIMDEVRVNASSGTRMILTNTDDAFLYGSDNFIPNKEAILKLYSRIAKEPGVDCIQISHTSFPGAISDPRLVEELSGILIEKTRWKNNGKRVITSEIGIESGSVRLMRELMRGKAQPYDIGDWPEIVVEGTGIYNDNNWYPIVTLMTGLPEEGEEDLLRTMELLDRLKDAKLLLTPLLFVPLEDSMMKNSPSQVIEEMTPLQWEFVTRCWDYNVRTWAPEAREKIKIISLFLYPYYRFKHGEAAREPMLKFTGWR